VLGALLLVASALAIWARGTLFDADGFADRVAAAYEAEAVRRAIADRAPTGRPPIGGP
jgi:hypothetical protein